eukprot:406418-Rhodomonas_salina.2
MGSDFWDLHLSVVAVTGRCCLCGEGERLCCSNRCFPDSLCCPSTCSGELARMRVPSDVFGRRRARRYACQAWELLGLLRGSSLSSLVPMVVDGRIGAFTACRGLSRDCTGDCCCCCHATAGACSRFGTTIGADLDRDRCCTVARRECGVWADELCIGRRLSC